MGSKKGPAPGQVKSSRERRRALAKTLKASERSRRFLRSIGEPRLAAEKVPGWIHEEVRAAEANASPGTLPAVLLRREGEKARDALVVVRLSELSRHFGMRAAELGGLSEGGEG